MTTSSTCDYRARHLSMAARTNLWIYSIAFFLTIFSCISFLLIVVYSKKVYGIVMFLKHRKCCENRNAIYFRDFGKINTLHSFIFINKYDCILR